MSRATSRDDLLFTGKLVEAGKVLGVEILDHLILGSNRFVSLKQRGAM
ncbi:MAG TPA: JAB domain-containing protein [Thermoanaerobaculia bacterium]|nr:JAB domain-containing protein [Thermoanaerobaculia bacterium]